MLLSRAFIPAARQFTQQASRPAIRNFASDTTKKVVNAGDFTVKSVGRQAKDIKAWAPFLAHQSKDAAVKNSAYKAKDAQYFADKMSEAGKISSNSHIGQFHELNEAISKAGRG